MTTLRAHPVRHRFRRMSRRAFWRRFGRVEHEQLEFNRITLVAHETQVDLRIRCLSVAGAHVVAITVPPIADRVVTTPDGRLLWRLGATNQPLRGDAVARFVQARRSAPA